MEVVACEKSLCCASAVSVTVVAVLAWTCLTTVVSAVKPAANDEVTDPRVASKTTADIAEVIAVVDSAFLVTVPSAVRVAVIGALTAAV